MNSYFIVKIAAIVPSFTPVNYDELIFSRNLILKPKQKFNLPPISIDETENIIKKQKVLHREVIKIPICGLSS